MDRDRQQLSRAAGPPEAGKAGARVPCHIILWGSASLLWTALRTEGIHQIQERSTVGKGKTDPECAEKPRFPRNDRL